MMTYLYDIGYKILAPVFQNYVLWILKNAMEKNIKVLYFLSRDGYLLYKIAILLCQKINLDIECRYLYCSRYSLRLPTYHFIDKDEALNLIFANSNKTTLKNVFIKTEFDLNEIEKILKINNLNVDINKNLNYTELLKIKEKLAEDIYYQNLVKQKSISAYNNIIEYLKQEKIFEFNKIGIVDSGWTGSMQRSLRQILEHGRKNISITGFYFGLFSIRNNEKDGEYCSWYFSPHTKFWNKVLFCNNVLECMLAAPHEMTIGYQRKNSKWLPKLKNNTKKIYLYKLINAQIEGCLNYVKTHINEQSLERFDNNIALKNSFEILYKFMVFPSKNEVDAYNKFLFCDDVSDEYCQSLADKSQINLLPNYLIIRRIMRKIRKKNSEGLFWAYGTSAYLPVYKRCWYRLNIILGEILRYLMK